jgi:pimeloyl-ACP methyl ester carboxylesterase
MAATISKPLLVAFYSGGFTAPQGRNFLRLFLKLAGEHGFDEHLVLDHASEMESPQPQDFPEYGQRLLEKVDAVAADKTRPIAIVAHSLGTRGAYSLALKLGQRCVAFYPVASRAPTDSSTDEVFGVPSRAELEKLDIGLLLRRMVAGWPNPILETEAVKPPAEWHPSIMQAMEVVRKQYTNAAMNFGSGDLVSYYGALGPQKLHCPVIALCGTKESPLGETPQKAARWSELVASPHEFALHELEGYDHFSIFKPERPKDAATFPVWRLIFDDLKARLASRESARAHASTDETGARPKTLSFIDSPFSTKLDYEAWKLMPSAAEREAALSAALRKMRM